MTKVNVYRAGTKIDSREFQGNFLIIRYDSHKFAWGVDGESILKPVLKRGHIMIWFIAAGQPPRINFIPPKWQLSVDGAIIFEGNEVDKDRFDIPINGRVVELIHEDLSFIFHLSPDDATE
jgi:hypothetical protein